MARNANAAATQVSHQTLRMIDNPLQRSSFDVHRRVRSTTSWCRTAARGCEEAHPGRVMPAGRQIATSARGSGRSSRLSAGRTASPHQSDPYRTVLQCGGTQVTRRSCRSRNVDSNSVV
uniref:Uncharacterized protein n=1 Tax=Rhodococcus sp. NS1 TaxID=402236 RepID=A0A097SPP7_9NOCA|nr:hypothetical protein LRS1606.63 [Rhodococcus sp. NS1]